MILDLCFQSMKGGEMSEIRKKDSETGCPYCKALHAALRCCITAGPAVSSFDSVSKTQRKVGIMISSAPGTNFALPSIISFRI
jgi:hypothetical protein